MTAPAHPDLLEPPDASDGTLSWKCVDEMADALLQRFCLEEAADAPAVAAEMLNAEAEDALYAWGVACYTKGSYGDAAALFSAVRRRRPPSFRMALATGAAYLACGEHARAAQAFARAHDLDPTDPGVLFHWAEAEYLRSDRTEALRLLRIAGEPSRIAGGSRSYLERWAVELRAQIEHSSPLES